MPSKKSKRMFCGGLRVGAAAPEAPSVASELRRAEANDALPKQLKVDFSKRLGRGANNAVYKGTFGETSVAVRLPVTKADTQCYVRAAKEAALALKAAELHAGPKVLDAWYVRHGNDRIKSGLGMVLQLLDVELSKVLLFGEPGEAAQAVEGTLRALNALASEGIVLTDLKPQNVMVKPPIRGGAPTVRVIDFGSEFAEAPFAPFRSFECPLLGFLHENITEDPKLQQHLLASARLVQLSATTTRDLHSRFQRRLKRPVKTPVSALAAATAKHLDGMRLTNVAHVRQLLRREAFKSVLRHYGGRHNAGTGRTLRFARGIIS